VYKDGSRRTYFGAQLLSRLHTSSYTAFLSASTSMLRSG
jgi:hypothetical protein